MNDSHQRSFPPLPVSVCPDSSLIITPICLAASLPEPFAAPKFCIGQTVLWAQVPSHGFGKIIGCVFAHSVSVKAIGYHYAIALDDSSPSRADCAADWVFEEDLELVSTYTHLLHC